MVATSGARLISEDAVEHSEREDCFPWRTVLTPNIPEAEVLSGMDDQDSGGYGAGGGADR